MLLTTITSSPEGVQEDGMEDSISSEPIDTEDTAQIVSNEGIHIVS